MDSSKKDLIDFLVKYGKTLSWEALASKFGLKSGEVARQAWKTYRTDTIKRRNQSPQIPDNLKDYPVCRAPLSEFEGEMTPRTIDPVAILNKIKSFTENLEDQTAEVVIETDSEIKTLEDLITKTKIDTEKWVIIRYVQNYWGNVKNPYWQVKAWLSLKPKESKFKEEFLKFLGTFKAQQRVARKQEESTERWGCLILNKQDAHLNKLDIKGDNNLPHRFAKIERYIENVIDESEKLAALDKIVYILGSDQFNSEWHNATTKGTPQTNVVNYQDGFAIICEHEVRVINLLLESCNELEILYIPGNHDEYVGWHMVNWLKAYYKGQPGLKINDHPSYTKYIRYHSTAMMFNHGDGAKPIKLASIFPMEFKEWSECKYYLLFTGDKHFETSNDFSGIKHYQIPQLSKSQSGWDTKQGYVTSNGELTSFLIDRQYGLRHIFKQPIS